jgi:CPA1 family monovalent cation:H+ antiporter
MTGTRVGRAAGRGVVGMTTEIWAIVFGLSVLLALAVVLQPVARFVRLPYTVLLAIVGAALAFLVDGLGLLEQAAHGPDHHAPIWEQALGALAGLRVTADVILFIFLPALVFESALSLDLRKLRKDLAAILFLAIIGVLLSAVIAGVTLSSYSGMALVTCLLVGAIVSATDPVAVISLFKDLGAPKRLTILVEGESLFNDATAIVVATIFLGLLTATVEPNVGLATLDFLRVFGVGIIVGVLVGHAAILVIRPFKDHAISVVSLTVVLPFIAFVLAEHFLHVSGVMAAVVAGLAVGSEGRKVIPPQIFAEIEHTWHQIAFWATALIFVLVGIAVPTLLGDHFMEYIDEAIILFVTATLARMVIIYGFIPLLARFGLIDQVSRAFQTIMVWGGLRGAVSLALALIVLDFPGIDPEVASFVAVLVTVFVFATLLLQATTIPLVMKLLGLDRLSAVDEMLRSRSLAWARQSVHDELQHIVEAQGSEADEFSDILDAYEQPLQGGRAPDELRVVSVNDWVRTGMGLALGQERQFYLEAYGDGAISGARLRELIARVDETSDAVRATKLGEGDDLSALRTAVAQFTRHTDIFTRAQLIQRRTGWVAPLADALATRFNVMTAARATLKRQEAEGLADITALLPPEAAEAFRDIYSERRQLVERAHEALWLQYPDFAAAVDRRNVARAGLRLEAQAYDRLRENGLIGPEVYGALTKSLETRGGVNRLPKLTLAYDPLELIAHVPLFRETTPGERRKIASKLKTIFVAPGEKIIAVGDPGDSMFFIADGAVEILLGDGEVVRLGTGDFFGELALLTGEPRTADVVSEGYGTLLKLAARDFEKVMERNPKLARRIREEGGRRLGHPALT